MPSSRVHEVAQRRIPPNRFENNALGCYTPLRLENARGYFVAFSRQGRWFSVKHLRNISRKPVVAQNDVDLPFIIATLQLITTVLTALQTKKQNQV